ncbi:MAG: AMP-binding protein, partial [bacterium]|nr:AMP-binding protein [bacterium]
RTTFTTAEGVPKQRIHQSTDFSIERTSAPAGESDHLITGHASFIFDLSEGPLFNIKLVKTGKNEHFLLLNMHHIIGDGWSMDILMLELAALYAGNSLPPLRIQYKDYAHWQNRALEDSKTERIKAYWFQKLSRGNDIPLLELPVDFPRPPVRTYNGKSIDFRLDAPLTSAVTGLCRQQEVTLFMLLLAAVNVLFYRYTGQEDIIIGTPVAGRDHPDLEEQVGCYVNTLALRNNIDGNQSFQQFLEQVKQTAADAYENQMYPFDRLVDQLDLARDTSRHPLFDVMVLLETNRQDTLKPDRIEITPVSHQYNISKFDMTFDFRETGEHIEASIGYNTDLFQPARIRRLCSHLEELIKGIIDNPSQPLYALNILSPEEKHQLLKEFNNTGADYPKDKTITGLFEDQVNRSPENIAAVSNETQITYKELYNCSVQLAQVLTGKGVQPGKIIGIMLERSIEMVIGILGILKAGGAYLPIDPEYPEERIRFMLEDSNSLFCISDHWMQGRTQGIAPTVARSEVMVGANFVFALASDPANLAYVIYTS